MAHTDRDDARWFWKDHYRNRKCDLYRRYLVNGFSVRVPGSCWCERDLGSWDWRNPYRYEKGVPSVWHRDQRRAERAHARNLMAKARNGHVDWDDLTIAYRRPYYW